MPGNLVPGAFLSNPDFNHCDAFYGELEYQGNSCQRAADQLPRGTNRETWLVNSSDSPFSLPLTVGTDGCYVTVEVAGPTTIRGVSVVPNRVRAVAYFVVQQCVVEQNIGGFATQNFGGLLNIVGNPLTDPEDPYPASTTFLTVTVSGPSNRRYAPGNTDPHIPITIGDYLYSKIHALPYGGSLKNLYTVGSNYWISVAQLMDRGGSKTWWETKATEENSGMTYKCDAGLGSPSYPDCSRLAYELPALNSVTLTAGGATFFNRDNCYMALTVGTIIVINWSQIRAALDTLLNLCVGPPLQDPAGGRAFYGPMPRFYNGRKKKRSDLTGMNALPPHVNITVFEQLEPWTNTTGELNSCTWKAVSSGSSVKTCNVG